MELTERQRCIVDILKKYQPITAEQIADQLGVSKATIRSDLAVLVMTNFIDAKPKVGYFLGTKQGDTAITNRISQLQVHELQHMPVTIRPTTSIYDAIITLFIEDVGSLIITNEDGNLEGIVSRKDLLKFTLSEAEIKTIPISMAMVRASKVITVTPETTVSEAAQKLIHYEINTLPVITETRTNTVSQSVVTGRISKTEITKLFIDLSVNKI